MITIWNNSFSYYRSQTDDVKPGLWVAVPGVVDTSLPLEVPHIPPDPTVPSSDALQLMASPIVLVIFRSLVS